MQSAWSNDWRVDTDFKSIRLQLSRFLAPVPQTR